MKKATNAYRDCRAAVCDRRGLFGFAVLAPLVVGLVAGCGDSMLDTGLTVGSVLGTEAPPAEPESSIRRMTGENAEWPNLGTVPPRPRDVPTATERRDERRRLIEDREASQEAGAALRGLEPLPVPPPPGL